MALDAFSSEGGTQVTGQSITPIFESAASGLQSMIPDMGPTAPEIQTAQIVHTPSQRGIEGTVPLGRGGTGGITVSGPVGLSRK